MSGRVDVVQSDDVELAQRRAALLTPAILATCFGVSLLGLSLLLWVTVVAMLHAHPDQFLPAGTVSLSPSGPERARIIAEHVLPVVMGTGLLALTWLYRHQGRSTATWICATATILIGVASLFR